MRAPSIGDKLPAAADLLHLFEQLHWTRDSLRGLHSPKEKLLLLGEDEHEGGGEIDGLDGKVKEKDEVLLVFICLVDYSA
jgi:hypothetical protein